MASTLNIDSLIDDIIEGLTYRQMAAKYECSLGTIHNFLSKDEHSARANEARQASADGYADKAEQVLIDAPADRIELQRARELAHHYRWKASKRNPKNYGDKLETKNEHTGEIKIIREIKK